MKAIIAALLFFACADGHAPPKVQGTGDSRHLAFVLLPEAKGPSPEDVARAFSTFASDGEGIRSNPPAENAGPATEKILQFQLTPRGSGFILLVPAAVPEGEADHWSHFSMSALGTGWTLPPHQAHLVVTLGDAAGDSPIESLSTFTSLLAAVGQASGAVAIYWGDAGATHSAEFFLATAGERDWTPKLMLWSGVSVSREPDGRHSLLSLGMKQLSLPDLLMIVPPTWEGSDALAIFFDLLAHVAERGEPLPEGDTIGRTADERRPVTYVPSPSDPSKKVWRVEFE